MTTGYSGTPLPKKLGIQESSRVLLLGSPAEFSLEGLPAGARVVHRRSPSALFDVILLFSRDRATLQARFDPLVGSLTVAGALWACWPKRASGVISDLNENIVRDCGLASGLVDVKIAAIDPTWSGLKFVRRLADRHQAARGLVI